MASTSSNAARVARPTSDSSWSGFFDAVRADLTLVEHGLEADHAATSPRRATPTAGGDSR